MLRFLTWRILQSLLVIWAVYTLTFAFLMLAPGDPFIGEKSVPDTVRATLAQNYGLPFLARPKADRDQLTTLEKTRDISQAYFLYLQRIAQGDLGPSIAYENFSVAEIIAHSLPVSIALGALALLLALWFGILAGTLGAIYRGRSPDLALAVFTLLGVSLPTFVTGSLLLMLGAVILPLLPSGGWGTLAQLILPATTLALFYLAYIARLTRVSVLDVLHSDFVRTARAKGLPPFLVISRHVLANAGLPVVSFLGPAAATVLTGSFVVEKLFTIPGLGTHFVGACLFPDIPLVLGTVLVYTSLIVAFNLLVDIAYVFIDPRVSLN